MFLSLFVPPNALQPRLTMCVTGLVACFAFQFSIADVMPSVAYLTLADVLFITVYVLAILCVLVAVLTHVWDSSGQPERAQKLQRASRILAPIAMGVAILLALPKGVAELPSTAEVSLDLPRHASARSVVRIGTTSPLRLSSSPVGAASFWGLSLRLGEGRAQPLWLTEMPRIDSKNMRFLSDGSLEVTWQLRENARWSDGSLILIEDLLRPLKERPDPRILSWNTQEDGRLTLIWQERVVDALRAPTLWPTAHLDAHVDTADQTDLRQYLGYALRPTLGPYMPIEVDDTKAVAIRNPHFPFAAANIERIELYTFEDSASLRAALLSGEIDITTPNALSPSDYAHFKAHPSLSAVETDSANFLFLAPNLTDAPWNQREARHALLQAIDRAQLVDDAWGEAGRVAHVPTTELPADLLPVDYNPDEARTTLEALGLVGQTVRLHWSTPTSEYFITQLASALEAVGLVVELERVRSSWPLWISKEYEGLLVHQQRIEQTTPMATWWALPLLDGRPDTTHRHDAWTDGTEALLTDPFGATTH